MIDTTNPPYMISTVADDDMPAKGIGILKGMVLLLPGIFRVKHEKDQIVWMIVSWQKLFNSNANLSTLVKSNTRNP